MYLHNGNTTDLLIKDAQKINDININKRELDMLISAGEQTSAAKLVMCLNTLGYDAISLTGWQIPIITNNNYNNADIISINLNRIFKELENNKIVVVAGFQGVDEYNNITTLGRGGSDLTAVALAASTKAKRCDIYKDVDGVYDYDPKTNKYAKKYDTINYDDMLNLSNNGAKILHNKSIELAKKFNVIIHVKSLYNKKSSGTYIK